MGTEKPSFSIPNEAPLSRAQGVRNPKRLRGPHRPGARGVKHEGQLIGFRKNVLRGWRPARWQQARRRSAGRCKMMVDGIMVPVLALVVLAALWIVVLYRSTFFGPKADWPTIVL